MSRAPLGQHFLIDAGRAAAMVASLGARPGMVVEIGPGRGALTFGLAAAAERLLALEKDPRLAADLQRAFADRPQVEIRCADALEEDLSACPAGFRLIGNLPYAVATPLLLRWMRLGARVADLTVMVQREVARRLAAPPGDPARGRLSVLAQLLLTTELMFDLEPECFDPPPQVVSSVLRLAPRPRVALEAAERPGFERLVARAFAARRKTLRNNLPELSAAAWDAAGIDPGRRAETLSVAEFLRLHAAGGAAGGSQV